MQILQSSTRNKFQRVFRLHFLIGFLVTLSLVWILYYSNNSYTAVSASNTQSSTLNTQSSTLNTQPTTTPSQTDTSFPFARVFAINRLKRINRLTRIRKIIDFVGLSKYFNLFIAIDKGNYDTRLYVITTPRHSRTSTNHRQIIDSDWSVIERSKQIRNMNAGEIAVYASHIQVLHKIVAEGLDSALILEDDVDMDVNVIQQINQVTRPLKTAQNTSGWDWDVIYYGHCLEERNDPRPLLFTTPKKDFGLSKAIRPLCLHAYAVSLKGAAKILENAIIATNEIKLQIDDTIADMFAKNILVGYTVNPQMIIQARKSVGSDLRPPSYLYSLGEPDPRESAESRTKDLPIDFFIRQLG